MTKLSSSKIGFTDWRHNYIEYKYNLSKIFLSFHLQQCIKRHWNMNTSSKRDTLLLDQVNWNKKYWKTWTLLIAIFFNEVICKQCVSHLTCNCPPSLWELIFLLLFFCRQDVHCFGDDTCYSLAFGVPAILMAVATVILVIGKNMYVHKAPQGSVLTQVIGSIFVRLLWIANH